MRYIQNILLVIGATAFGGLAGGLGSFFVMSSLFKEPRSENFGGALIWVACVACGAALMALAGLVGALYRIARHEPKPWSLIVWIGIASGVAVGLAVYVRTVFGSVDRFYQVVFEPGARTWYVWLGAGFLSGAFGAVGGAVASLVPGSAAGRGKGSRINGVRD